MLPRQDGVIGIATAADTVRGPATTMVPVSGETAQAAAPPAVRDVRAATGMDGDIRIEHSVWASKMGFSSAEPIRSNAGSSELRDGAPG